MRKRLDKVQGCLVGGAVGDALGYAVEFLSYGQIVGRYGCNGIQEYTLRHGVAQISDDTQMTLFTANGLLCADAKKRPYVDAIAQCYREWYMTQYLRKPQAGLKSAWLSWVSELYSPRAPGGTCLSAIEAGCNGTIEAPINGSKGCGGVMRVAPVGAYLAGKASLAEIALVGAQAAALTHGHELGYIPGALLAYIVGRVTVDDCTLRTAVADGKDTMKKLFENAKHLPEFLQRIDRAMALSETETHDLAAFEILGEGWCGDEALAVAIYCALKYEQDFAAAVTAAVNHNGDSDSTGAITGNILGAYLGLSAIPKAYLENLELLDVILEIGEDLALGRPEGEQGLRFDSKYTRGKRP